METIKDILEIIYFISGPVIAVFALFGLRQIKEARNQVVEAKNSRILSAKRDAFKIAAEKCSYYLQTIIPLFDNLDRAIVKSDIKYFEKSIVLIEQNEIKIKPYIENDEEFEKRQKLPELELFNPLEGFALFFTSGVADENIGFLTIGHTYCNSVRKLLPSIAPLGGDKYFQNIMKLYLMWNSRIEKEKLEKVKSKIDKKLSENKTITVRPIGTE